MLGRRRLKLYVPSLHSAVAPGGGAGAGAPAGSGVAEVIRTCAVVEVIRGTAGGAVTALAGPGTAGTVGAGAGTIGSSGADADRVSQPATSNSRPTRRPPGARMEGIPTRPCFEVLTG